MQHVRPPLALVLALAASLLGACGGDAPAPEPGATLAGPPLWRLSREGISAEATGCTLQARSPGRARVRLEATGNLTRTSPWRDLASGQTIVLSWSHEIQTPDLVTDVPTPEDVAAGRTEPHAALLTFGFSDRAQGRERYVWFARPGRGRLLTRDILPPGKYEPLAPDGPIELATLVLADLERGEASLRSHESRSRLVLPEGGTAQDRVHQVQLFLEVELMVQEAPGKTK